MPELSAERLAAIKAMKFTTGLNAACGHFDTDVERELYSLAATNWNALQELIRGHEALLRDHARLTTASAEAAEELATWTGALHT
ncbi:hypothetical protein [Streptomyces chryseus]